MPSTHFLASDGSRLLVTDSCSVEGSNPGSAIRRHTSHWAWRLASRAAQKLALPFLNESLRRARNSLVAKSSATWFEEDRLFNRKGVDRPKPARLNDAPCSSCKIVLNLLQQRQLYALARRFLSSSATLRIRDSALRNFRHTRGPDSSPPGRCTSCSPSGTR